ELRDHLVASLLGEIDGPDLHRERGHVLHEVDAIPVVDEAAGRRDGLDRGPVAFAHRRELAALNDLQVEQPGRQPTDGEDACERKDQEPAGRPRVLLASLEIDHRGARSSSCENRSWIETASGPRIAARTTSYTTPGAMKRRGSVSAAAGRSTE